MLIEILLVAHIAVLGYWLGGDLVINSIFRYVARSSVMSFAERDRLMDHVMDIDQHVRYALLLQLGLGTALAALLGYLPGGAGLAAAGGLVAAAWLILVEITHRRRQQPGGEALARFDRALRYLAIAAAVALAGSGLAGLFTLAGWLAWKLLLFGAVIACGLGIRLELIRYFAVWAEIRAAGSTPDREMQVRRQYARATTILITLWLCIAGIVALSLFKP